MIKMVKKHNIKLNDMDRNNRSVTSLRYLAIFTIHNFEELFITEQIKSVVHEGIYDYFYPRNEKTKELKLISVYAHINYVEINFQALPVLKLKKVIEELHIHSEKYILERSKQLQLRKNLWSENIFLGTRQQIVKQQFEAYLNIQKTLSTIEKLKKKKKVE